MCLQIINNGKHAINNWQKKKKKRNSFQQEHVELIPNANDTSVNNFWREKIKEILCKS